MAWYLGFDLRKGDYVSSLGLLLGFLLFFYLVEILCESEKKA